MSSRDDFVIPPEEIEDPPEVDAPAYVPLIYRWGSISHYYGDSVRILLISAAALMLVGAPFYTDDLSSELPFIVVSIFVMVAVAALTTPSKRSMIQADTIVAGVGLVIFEMWALLGYGESSIVQFVLREALALIFLFAFYFSTKTLRAMFLHQIGLRDAAADIRRDKLHGKGLDEFLDRQELKSLTKEEIYQYNQEVKKEYDD